MKDRWSASTKPLFLGLVFSLVLSIASYQLVTYFHLTGNSLLFSLFCLALLQALVQLIFFFHLSFLSRWYSLSLFFTLLVLVIIVGGSIWIMRNLDYNLMNFM